MYCPHCGQHQMMVNARFCSACGLALSKVKELLDENIRRVTSTSEDSHDSSHADTITFQVPTPIEEIEREMIISTLKRMRGNKIHTAELLKISLKTLHNKLHVYGQNQRAS
jgi:DNA-binding NtrC family response regulator